MWCLKRMRKLGISPRVSGMGINLLSAVYIEGRRGVA